METDVANYNGKIMFFGMRTLKVLSEMRMNSKSFVISSIMKFRISSQSP